MTRPFIFCSNFKDRPAGPSLGGSVSGPPSAAPFIRCGSLRQILYPQCVPGIFGPGAPRRLSGRAHCVKYFFRSVFSADFATESAAPSIWPGWSRQEESLATLFRIRILNTPTNTKGFRSARRPIRPAGVDCLLAGRFVSRSPAHLTDRRGPSTSFGTSTDR